MQEASNDTEQWSRLGGVQRVGAFVGLPSLIRELGADPDLVLGDAGLADDALSDREEKIPYAAVGRLLKSAVLHTHCAHFGLLAGRLWHLADLGIPGEIMRNSDTVGDALRRLTSFQSVNSGGVVPFLREAGTVVDFGCAIYEPGLIGVDQATDMYMAAAVNFLRELCGPDWCASEVFLPHSQPEHVFQHRSFLTTTPHFNSEFCAIRFDAHWLQRRVAGADPKLLRNAQRCARAEHPIDIAQAVNRVLRVLLLNGESSGDEVAKLLGMHRRTLNRRLKAVGTTYQGQLDRVRFEAARQLLCSSDIALDDLAAALGYSGISPFMRSCKRWTGTTPTKWRQVARNDESLEYGAASTHQANDDGSPRREQYVRDGHGARVAQYRNRAA